MFSSYRVWCLGRHSSPSWVGCQDLIEKSKNNWTLIKWPTETDMLGLPLLPTPLGLWVKEKVMLRLNFVLGRQGERKFVFFVIWNALDNFLNYFTKDCSDAWFSIIRTRGHLNVCVFGYSLSSTLLRFSSFLVSGSWDSTSISGSIVFFDLIQRVETRQSAYHCTEKYAHKLAQSITAFINSSFLNWQLLICMENGKYLSSAQDKTRKLKEKIIALCL